jgi:hypothetical protein
MRSKIEPPEHIMRAPVAAQGCDCLVLLPKSLSCRDASQKAGILLPATESREV